MWGLAGVAILGLAGIVAYAAQSGRSDFLAVSATSLVVASASALVGGLLGFLFAIPRGPRVESPSGGAKGSTSGALASQGSSQSDSSSTAGVRSNTNLEDISDWLTKILVGVGLTQLGTIGAGLAKLGNALEPALGDAPNSGVFGVALVITFALIGFLGAYLWTRLTLPIAFQRAETEVEDELRRALRSSKLEQQEAAADVLALVDRPDVEGAVVQKVAQRLSATSETPTDPERFLREKATEYERIRNQMPASDQRTREMSRIVAEVRGAAQGGVLPPDTVRSLFRSGDGGRVVALAYIGANPDPGLVDIVRDCVAHSRSAFEQYHALRAAEAVAPLLSEADRHELAEAVRLQMGDGPGQYIQPRSDRWPVAERVQGILGSSDL
jgi:hypothetical protein